MAEGWASGEAANGAEAITLTHTLQPNVVLIDMNMPQLNGIEATTVIKRDFRAMVVVGLSVNADRGNSRKKRQWKSCITPSSQQ
jgi:pilus assembly protein CpaE